MTTERFTCWPVWIDSICSWFHTWDDANGEVRTLVTWRNPDPPSEIWNPERISGQKMEHFTMKTVSNSWIKLAITALKSSPPSSSCLFTAVTLILSPCHWEQGFIVLWLWKHADTQLVNEAWLCWAVNYEKLAVWLIKITLLNVFIVQNPGPTCTKPQISYPLLTYGNNICHRFNAESVLCRILRSFLMKTSKLRFAVWNGSFNWNFNQRALIKGENRQVNTLKASGALTCFSQRTQRSNCGDIKH